MNSLANDSNRRRILLVDDDPTLRETLAEQLGFHEEYTVSEAENGSEAMKLADADHFDAMVGVAGRQAHGASWRPDPARHGLADTRKITLDTSE